MELHYNDQSEMKKKLFTQDSSTAETRMPMIMKIADIPRLHHYNDEIGKNFLKQLACTEGIDTMYTRVYI